MQGGKLIQITDFEWDSSNSEHIQEHGVRNYEVEEVLLFDEPIYYKGKEGRYCVFGVTNDGRYLFIVFAVKGTGIIRVITARNMTKTERKLYNKRGC
jgi:uncharacterized DUF497 family protein